MPISMTQHAPHMPADAPEPTVTELHSALGREASAPFVQHSAGQV